MKQRTPAPIFLSVLASSTPAVACLYVLPYLVTAAVDGLGVSAVRAGFGATLEVAAMAVSSLGLASWIGRSPLRRVATLGCSIALLGSMASAVTTSWPLVVAFRTGAGLGAGAALAAGQAAAARDAEPDRLFARVVFWRATTFAVLLPLFPLALQRWGHHGVFACMTAVTSVCLMGCRLLPNDTPARRASDADAFSLRTGAAVLTATVVFALGDAALWSFSERLGLAAGAKQEQLGALLSLSVFAGLAGSALAGRLGTAAGGRVPIVLGCSITAIAALAVTGARGTPSFALAIAAYGGAVFFMLPYIFGTAARLDPVGRLSAAAGGALLVGTALGPTVGGALVERYGTPAIGPVAAISASVAALLLLRSTRRRAPAVPAASRTHTAPRGWQR